MKNIFKRVCSFALLVLMSALMMMPALADGYVEWELSDDENTLIGDGVEYKKYDAPIPFYEHSESIYWYEDYVYGDMYRGSICAPKADSDFVWMEDEYGSAVVFTKGDAAANFDRFFAGEGVYCLTDGNRVTTLANDVAAKLKTYCTSRTEPVSELKNVTRYELAVYDDTRTFFYNVGGLFLLDENYWYVDYATLGNQHFDANGNFSFRSGEVTLSLVDADAQSSLKKCVKNMKHVSTDYSWEDYDPYYENVRTDSEDTLTVFWVSYSILGFVIPLCLAAAAIVLANLKKLGRPKHFCRVAVICGIWIACAAVLAVMMM